MPPFTFVSDAQIYRAYTASGDVSVLVKTNDGIKRMLVSFDVFGNAILSTVK